MAGKGGLAVHRPVSLLALLFSFVAGTFLLAMAQQAGQPSAIRRSSPKGTASPGKLAGRQSIATLQDGRLSVKAQGLPLKSILDEISRKATVAFVQAAGVGGQPTSVQFQDLTLEEGLRQILKDYDTFFFYGAEREAPASLKVVWVYPKGRGKGLAPVPPEEWASTKEVEGMLGDSDPEVRARAIETLIERKRGQALDAVLQALRDKDDRVRGRALYAALSRGVKPPPDTLIDLALNDASPDVRFLAPDALSDHPDVRAIAERALEDPSPPVQNKAQEILRRLDAATRPPKPRQPQQVQPRP